MMITLGQMQMLPLLTHRGWIPHSPWNMLEDLRWRHLEHLDYERRGEEDVYLKYAEIEKNYRENLADVMYEQDVMLDEYGENTMQLVPPENELANARTEQAAWVEALVDIGRDVRETVEDNAADWQGRLGNVEGLIEFASHTDQVQRYLQHAAERYGHLAPPGTYEQIVELIGQLPQEARRVQRLHTWLEVVSLQPLGIGFAFYEDKSQVPEIHNEEDEDVDSPRNQVRGGHRGGHRNDD